MIFFFKKIFRILRDYSCIAIYRRAKEIIITFFCHSKKQSKFFVEENKAHSHNLSIVAIVKNESMYIKEWIEYHILIGIEHFYIYDNESKDNLHQILFPYIEKGFVSYIFCPGPTMQMPAYNDAIVRFREINKWMAFIDIDEFIVLNPFFSSNIVQFLKSYENYDMLGINWNMFDFNNHNSRPTKGFVISNYTRCYRNTDNTANKHIKCIVKPKSIKICTCPHYMHLKSKKIAVDEDFNRLVTPFPPHVSTKKIRINHYFSKSKEEYITKLSRGRSDSPEKRKFDQKAFDFSYTDTKQSDIDLSSFVEKLKDKIPETYR